MTLIDSFKAARRVSTPLLGITSADPFALVRTLTAALNGQAPVLTWDFVHGLQGKNAAGAEALDALLPPGASPEAMTINPTEALRMAERLPDASCLFFLNAHRFVDNEGVAQALLNLRDMYKSNHRTLVLLAPVLTLPVEHRSDVMVFDDPLPDDTALAAIVDDLHVAAKLPALTPAVREQAVHALRGLSAFMAEEVTAMSLTRQGLNLEQLWTQKRAVINATDGLTVDDGADLPEVGGLAELLTFADDLGHGPYQPLVIVRIDEIDKAMAGAGGETGQGDTSGTSQDAHGVILQAMEDYDWPGMLLLGAPGTGKTLVSRALGSRLGAITLSLDLGALKGSLVGESERKIRTAMKVILALGGRRRVLFVATCNRLDSLRPELRRRFQRRGMWFTDLPTAEERTAIWRIQLARYGLTDERRTTRDGLPEADGWTGAEVRNCCELAAALGRSPKEAARYIVPISQSDPDLITQLRRLAHGRFLSAASPGPYRYERQEAAPSGRAVRFAEEAEPPIDTRRPCA